MSHCRPSRGFDDRQPRQDVEIAPADDPAVRDREIVGVKTVLSRQAEMLREAEQ